jgi:hypothetical protein
MTPSFEKLAHTRLARPYRGHACKGGNRVAGPTAKLRATRRDAKRTAAMPYIHVNALKIGTRW